uniref:dUTPase-like domain-containing protein n=1 Tax=Macaca fascicularis TaxID=9541 RepID=A0A7N9DAN7_MACFA
MIPLNWKLRLPHGHFGLLLLLSQQAQKGVKVLAGVIDPDYQDEISLLFHNRGKKEYEWNTGDSVGCFLVLPCPVTKVNGKIQQPNPSTNTNGPYPSRIKIWVTPSVGKTKQNKTKPKKKNKKK